MIQFLVRVSPVSGETLGGYVPKGVFMRRLSRVHLFCLLVFSVPIVCSAGAKAPAMRVMSFDEAAQGFLVRSIPLNVAIPAHFELHKNAPTWGTYLWISRRSFDHFQKEGFPSPTEGVIQIRITTSVGYSSETKAFLCGPSCDESTMLKMAEASGAKGIVSSKHFVKGFPIFFLESTMTVEGYPPTRVYIAYIGTLIDTNVVLFSYTPPSPDDGASKEIWAAIKKALLASK